MKKQILCCLTIMTLFGCVDNNVSTVNGEEQIKQEADEFVQNLENSGDAVEIIKAYIKYFVNGLQVWVIYGDMLHYHDVLAPNGLKDSDPKIRMITQKLSEPGTNYDCVGNNQSDECILYRRNLHETKVAYFDYKRFLGKGTTITTDESFIKLIQIYDIGLGCEEHLDITTDEKNGCKERYQNALRLLVKQKVHCKDLLEFEYRKQLKSMHDDYKYSVDTWKFSHSYAMEKIGKQMRFFAEQYMCDTSGWQTDIFK